MAHLAIPASVAINMLYKQIVMSKSIPFSLSVSNELQILDEIKEKVVPLMRQNGLNDAKKGNSRLAKSVFDDFRLNNGYVCCSYYKIC